VVLLLSGDYATMFHAKTAQTDKHNRVHEVYAVSQAVRVGRRVAEAQAKLRSQRRPAAAAATSGPQPASVSDTGSHFIISGPTRESVAGELAKLAGEGLKVIAEPALVGAKWMATCENRSGHARIEKLGMKTVVSGATREAVQTKVTELVEFGARVDQDIEQIDGVWTAVLDDAG